LAHAVPITARSWLLADENSVIDGFNSGEVRSIASITKLVTVMIVVDAQQPLDELLLVPKFHTKLSRQTLIDMALVRSDNTAAIILCQNYYTGYNRCINAMNEKLISLSMNKTMVKDPTGLNKLNVSTAEDLVKLAHAAQKYDVIVAAGQKRNVSLLVNRRTISMKNTNPLVGNNTDIVLSKTGFINRSGGCILMLMQTPNGLRTIVVLGSKNTHTRIPEAVSILSNENNRFN
jgi:D-alanyl-D-alanine carboxypeptidase